jgi:DNA primase
MSRRIAEAELRRLRNDVDITALIQRLGIPWKRRDGYFRFLCPICGDFNTATNPRTNLGRCFRCRENFNPIDLVMRGECLSFLQAVEFLRGNCRDLPLRDDPQKA